MLRSRIMRILAMIPSPLRVRRDRAEGQVRRGGLEVECVIIRGDGTREIEHTARPVTFRVDQNEQVTDIRVVRPDGTTE